MSLWLLWWPPTNRVINVYGFLVVIMSFIVCILLGIKLLLLPFLGETRPTPLVWIMDYYSIYSILSLRKYIAKSDKNFIWINVFQNLSDKLLFRLIPCVVRSSFSTIDKSWVCCVAWWRHQMETFSALLAICVGNSPVTDEFPAQRPLAQSFDVFYDLRLNRRLSKPSWGWWFETPSRSLLRYRNVHQIWKKIEVLARS